MKVSMKGRRRKGDDAERELKDIIHGAKIRGRVLTARRVPLSGAMSSSGFGGDLLVGESCNHEHRNKQLTPGGLIHMCFACSDCENKGTTTIPGTEEQFEVKRRGNGFIQIDRWLDDAFAVCYRRDRGEWIITMRLSDLIENPAVKPAPPGEG